MTSPPAPSFEASGFFVARTPLLPAEEFEKLGEGLEAARAAEPDLAAALARDRAKVRAALRAWIERAFVREGIFLASPSTDESLGAWLEAPSSERGKKVENTLVRYFSRMSGRATPFGLFSACSTGAIGDETRLELDPLSRYRRSTRLDGHYLSTLTGILGRDAALRRALAIRPSSGLYLVAGRIRYVVSNDGENGRSYTLAAAEPSPHLEAALARAENGASWGEIAAAVREKVPDVTLEETDEFVGALLDQQILRVDLEPPVTGEEPLAAVLEQLRPLAPAAPLVSVLERTRSELASIDALGLGSSPDRYRAITESLRALPAPVDLSRLFQADMAKPGRLTLGRSVIEELARAAELARSFETKNDLLRPFREAFRQRYEDREVPLVLALDEEAGIGFERSNAPGAEASPLLKGIAFPQAPSFTRPTDLRKHGLQRSKLEAAWRSGASEVTVTEEEIRSLSPEPSPLPDAFAVMAVLVAISCEAVARGEFRVVFEGLSGPSGANLLGRFCHVDPALERGVREHLRREEELRPGAIFAEIVHLPEGRLGNIIFRPVLRGHELPFLGRSRAPLEKQIPIADLLLALEGDRVVLRSRRLGREVVPRLTTALNVQHPTSQGLHRFLVALGYQGSPGGLKWDWGAFDGSAFLPRVVCGKTVLARASWTIAGQKLRELAKTLGEPFAAVQALRRSLGLPRRVALADSDNVLPIDFENVLSVESFFQLVKGRRSARLVESYTGADELCMQGPEGRFVHELVVPFVRVPGEKLPARESERPVAASSSPGDAIERSFPPGSRWLYAKLYTGSSTADRVIREVVAPLVARALSTGAAERWFFIRYGDPDWHVRVRLEGEPSRLTGELLPALHALAAPLVAKKMISRIQLDTYEREVERYGGPEAILAVERIFQIDSEAALAIVARLKGDAGADARWRLALRGIDAIQDDLGLDHARKRTVIRRVRAAFGAEIGAGDAFWRQLGARFRQERAGLDALLDRERDETSPLAPALLVLQERSERLRPVVADLRARERAGLLGRPVDALADSLVHMHANRLLRSAQRAHEVVIYYFLDRLYESQAARARPRSAST
ncbi:lantibiotic dehydratase [bacterium]|nr:lantibiotic dehydratase [bacterium]